MRSIVAALLVGLAAATPLRAATPDPWLPRAQAMLKHAVEVPTVAGRGRTPELAAYLDRKSVV